MGKKKQLFEENLKIEGSIPSSVSQILMAVWPSGYGVRLRLHFFARAWCCCWFVVRWCKVYSCCQMTAALISDFFLSERTNSSFSNFAKTPKSIRLKSVSGGIQKYPHTFHPQHNNKNTCRTTKVAVPLLMSTSTTIYSPVQTCVLFNVIVSRVNSRFCSCCVC